MQSANEHSSAAAVERAVKAFQTTVANFEGHGAQALPDITDAINHNNKFLRIGESVLPSGLYVDDSHETLQPMLHEETVVLPQIFPTRRLGREDSHNGVFFAGLRISPEESPDASINVAVKSVEHTRADGLRGELAMFQYLGKLALPTFRPAGFIGSATGHNHLLTHYDGPVATLDTADWETTSTNERWELTEPGIDTMLLLHTNGISHGDLFFKNVGFNEAGKPVIVDPELMTSFAADLKSLIDAPMLLDAEQSSALTRVKQGISRDFSAFNNSIKDKIIASMPRSERPRGGEAMLKMLKKQVYEPYRSKLKTVDSGEAKVLLRAFDDYMVDMKERAKNDII